MLEEKIKERALHAIKERIFPGCVIGLIQVPRPSEALGEGGNKQIVIPLGTLDGIEPVAENTIYDLASITKSVPTASLALMFVAEGKLSLSDMVRTYVPELQNDHDATIEDLLRYRVKGAQLSKLQPKTFEEIRTHVFEHGFDGPPVESLYTNLPAFLLGIIVERVSGSILPALADQYFFEPLQMNDTAFFPSFAPPSHKATGGHGKASEGRPHDIRRIAPTEIIDGEEIRGIVHDESARVFAKAGRAVGHAGLFSTAPDLLHFLEALLAGNPPAGGPVVVDGARKGLGWEVDKEWMGKKRSGKTFGKTGFTGTSVLCDVEKGIGLAVLCNRTYPRRPPDNSAINAFRADIADIVFS